MSTDQQQRWLAGRVVERRQWTASLFSLYVDADPVAFEAGQFVKLALPSVSSDELLGRPYSFVNPPQERPHEFFCVVVPGGPLSPRLALLQRGAPIFLAARPSGFLVLSEVPDAKTLWLLSTGTGIGPFLSILRTEAPWRRFENVVLVHGTRRLADSVHGEIISFIAASHPQQFRMVSLVSQDAGSVGADILAGRIPSALNDGRLERAAGVMLDAQTSQVMLCGNPAMIVDMTDALKARGLKKHRRRSPGQITVENYW